MKSKDVREDDTLSGRGVCLKCLMCCDSLLSCGMKLREYCCCLCLLVFVLGVILITVLIKKCTDSGMHLCLSAILKSSPSNETSLHKNVFDIEH